MGRLTTHVLDTVRGQPAAGLHVRLYRLAADGAAQELAHVVLDADGRCAAPLLAGPALRPGRYRLVFAVADYFRASGTPLPDPPFLDRVPVDFGIAAADRDCHVPLLASPWAYSTYRGS